MKYPSVKQMTKAHVKGMQSVHKFLKARGADHWHDKYQFRGDLTIRIVHANNYIECGPHDEDPNDVLYYIWTQEDYEFSVPFGKLQGMLKALKANQSLSKSRIGKNIVIKTDITNQFIMEKRIRCEDYALDKVTLRIEFRIYHNRPNWEEYP